MTAPALASRLRAWLTPREAGSDAPSRPAAGALLGVAALYLFVAGAFQSLGEVPYDADTAYHIAVAGLIRAHGVLRAFPWTPFSHLAEHYADKELLFHLALIPFTGLSYASAGKLAGTLFVAAVLGAMAWVLHRERVSRAWLWPLVALSLSGMVTYRLTLVRPHLLSVILAMLGVWSLARTRRAAALAVGFLYPLSYIAWHTLLILAALVAVARRLSGRPRDLGAPLAACVGLLAGIVLHPNFPTLLDFWRVVHVDILLRTAWSARAGFELGGEFRAPTPEMLLRHGVVPYGLLLAALALAWRRRRDDATPLAFAFAAAAFGALTLRTQRFFEYLGPFATLAFALAAQRTRAERSAAGVMLVGALTILAVGRGPLEDVAARRDAFPPAIVRALRRQIPRGAQVFTCDWGMTGEMMLALPERRFMVALDPVLFYHHDPARYRQWYAMVRRETPGAGAIIRDRFGARFVLCDARPQWRPFLGGLIRDPDARLVVGSPLWAAFELRPLSHARRTSQ